MLGVEVDLIDLQFTILALRMEHVNVLKKASRFGNGESDM